MKQRVFEFIQEKPKAPLIRLPSEVKQDLVEIMAAAIAATVVERKEGKADGSSIPRQDHAIAP